jgi:hypothetical protein
MRSTGSHASSAAADVNLLSVMHTIIDDFNLAQRVPSQAALQKIMYAYSSLRFDKF